MHRDGSRPGAEQKMEVTGLMGILDVGCERKRWGAWGCLGMAGAGVSSHIDIRVEMLCWPPVV